jgi:CBS domain-containing protein
MEQEKHNRILARDIMTRKIISVLPNTPIVDAARIISDHNFDGIPVIDESNQLVGIITEYDLITKTSTINVSFLEKILGDVRGGDASSDGDKKISTMRAMDIMNTEPLTLKESSTFEEVMQTFITHHRVNPIPIVNDKNEVVGIISRFDVLRPLNLLSYGSKTNSN